MYKKNYDQQKLLTCVVGANDVLINYPEHDKNDDISHKKKFNWGEVKHKILLKKAYVKKKLEQKV